MFTNICRNSYATNEYSVMVIGKTGVGKSSLINSLFGKTVAEVGDDEATTLDIHKYTKQIQNYSINIYDTMGIYDDVGDPKEYIKKIAENVEKAHLILFCFDSSESRWTKDNKEIIELFKNELDLQIFENTIFVFTKYNVFRNSKSLENRKYKIKSNIFNAKFAVAENSKTRKWKRELWDLILEVAKKDIQPVLLNIIYKQNNICEISRNITKLLINEKVYPNYMDTKRTEVYKNCMDEIIQYNNRLDAVSYMGTLITYVNIPSIFGTGPLVSNGIGLSSGIGINKFINKFKRNSTYCDTILNKINTEKYQDTYEFTNGKYIGYFKKNLFNGKGKLFDRENYLIYNGEFRNGIPIVCS